MIRSSTATGSSLQEWKDIYRLLVTSLRSSSIHFQQLTVESLTVGLWGLTKAHAAAAQTSNASLTGTQLAPADRAAVTELVYWADVLLRTFDTPATTPAAVASSLGIQESCVLHFQPQSAPLLPAHAVIVDSSRQQVLLLVRGTSSWADCLTDLVAHTEPLGTGQAHSGLLDAARSVLQHCVPMLQKQLQLTPGFRIHCLGHSLGGGVAALATYLLRSTPEFREQLSAASGVMATGFGTPPVMTAELAESVGSFTRTLVHDCDLVPRTCVYSLSLLRAELEEQRDAVYANNSLLGSIKASGLLDSGGQLLTQAGVALLASKFAPGAGAGAAGKSGWMAKGLQLGASMVINNARTLHQEVMSTPTPALPAAASGHSSALPAAAQQQGTGSAAAGGAGGAFSFAAMRQAVSAAAASATATAAAAGGASSAAGSQPHNAAQGSQLSQEQQQQASADGFRSSQVPLSQQDEEEAAKVCLYCPGKLWHLRRTQGQGSDTQYELVQAVNPGSARFGGKIWVKRSMLSDHYLSQYMQGLLQFQAQLVEQAALLG